MSLKEDKIVLIKDLIEKNALKSKRVISAFNKIPRENFVLKDFIPQSYHNIPLPIYSNQTISQPYTVAIMTEELDVHLDHKVLEIGTGSGYQAAILSELVGKKGKVTTIERIDSLYKFAKKNLKNYKNIKIIKGDGSKGYSKFAPYDRIIITSEAPALPKSLIEQLKNNGKLVIPIKEEMYLIEKVDNKLIKTFLGYFKFVPLIGSQGY